MFLVQHLGGGHIEFGQSLSFENHVRTTCILFSQSKDKMVHICCCNTATVVAKKILHLHCTTATWWLLNVSTFMPLNYYHLVAASNYCTFLSLYCCY